MAERRAGSLGEEGKGVGGDDLAGQQVGDAGQIGRQSSAEIRPTAFSAWTSSEQAK
jgi:hypothetical protein